MDEAAKAVKGAFDAAQKLLQDARNDVIAEKEECKRRMSLKCDKCKQLKCRQAERDCKGFLDAAGKWIGGVVDAAGILEYLWKLYSIYFRLIGTILSESILCLSI